MFNNGLVEDVKDVIQLHSISSNIFQIILEFIYTGLFMFPSASPYSQLMMVCISTQGLILMKFFTDEDENLEPFSW